MEEPTAREVLIECREEISNLRMANKALQKENTLLYREKEMMLSLFEMMENRIKIGDEWYVKESSISAKENTTALIEKDDIIKGKFSLWENDSFCFESFHNIDTGVLESIEFIDKRNQSYPFTEVDYWDNEVWFKRVIDLDEGVWEEFDEGDTELIEAIKAFINAVYDIFY